MSTVKLAYDDNLTPEENLQSMVNMLNWAFSKLDSRNVKRLDTDETHIKSAEGETVINGPLIEMFDKQPVKRLQEGYDTASGDFIFKLFDKQGNNTVTQSDTGQFQLSGKPLLTMYDNQDISTLRLQMGYNPLLDEFLFQMFDKEGNNTVTQSETGEFQLNGKPLITMHDNQAVKRLQMGYIPEINDFMFQLFDSLGNNTVTQSATGQFQLTGQPLMTMYDENILRLKEGYDPLLNSFVFQLFDNQGNNTVSLSETGQFQLNGMPLLTMYDNQPTPTLRLQTGYDPYLDDFVFKMFDSMGNPTVTQSSSGQFQLTGMPLLSMYDNQYDPVLRLQMGYEPLLDEFIFQMFDKSGNMTIGQDSETGGAIFKGDVIGSKFYNVSKTGWIEIEQVGESNLANFKFRVDSTINPIVEFVNEVDNLNIKAFGNTLLRYSDVSNKTLPNGTYDCRDAIFINLSNGTSGYATTDYVDYAISDLATKDYVDYAIANHFHAEPIP